MDLNGSFGIGEQKLVRATWRECLNCHCGPQILTSSAAAGTISFQGMQEATTSPIPPSIDRVLCLFRSMAREEKMQALVQYSKKLEPFPERLSDVDRAKFNIPECQTRVDIVPELKDGKLHFYADLDVRRSPTIAAVLAIVFGAVNDQPPETTLGIPPDFVRIMMESIGLGAREPGLNAMITRLKRHALEAQSAIAAART